LEIEAEPWMEGVLEALCNILTPNLAPLENSPLAETNLSSTQATVVAEHPANGQSLLTEKIITSDISSEIDASLRTAENISNLVLSATSVNNDDNADINSSSIETSELHQNPSQYKLHSSSTDVLETSLVNRDAFMEKEKTDAEPVTDESLTRSLLPLSAMSLTVPLCPPRYLKLTILPDEKLVSGFLSFYH